MDNDTQNNLLNNLPPKTLETPKTPEKSEAPKIPQIPKTPEKSSKSPKSKKPRKKLISIIIFIVGLLTLIGGIVFLLFNILSKPDMRDAEFIVEAGTWTSQDSDNVIWNFTEIGKGSLTTNNHQNDYNFIWAIDNDVLKIETNWLYDLENEYTYKLDRSAKTLTLTSGNKVIVFKAAPAQQPTE